MPAEAQSPTDAYTTPKNKDGYFADHSNYDRYERIMKNLQAPKKRDEIRDDEDSGRNNKAYDSDSLSIRAFRLETNSDCDESTENLSGRAAEIRQAALEMRSQWNAFSERIQAASVPQKGGTLQPMRI